MKLGIKELALLGASLILDSVQGFVLFNMALCAVPSITGIGALLTAICGLAFLGIAQTGFFFSILYGLISYFFTGKKLFIAAGVLESIPVLNALPLFTATSLYHILKGGK